MRLDIHEQETVINVYPLRIATGAIVSTSIPKTINLLHKLKESFGDQMIALIDDGDTIVYEIPQSWIKIRPPRGRTFTEEQRDRQREILRLARERKAAKKNGTA